MKDYDPIRELLQAWKFDAQIPPRFQAEVWSRIRAWTEEEADMSLAAFIRWLFPSPAAWQLAAATAVAMLAVGASLGSVAANASNERSRVALAERYVETVDPYLQVEPPAAR